MAEKADEIKELKKEQSSLRIEIKNKNNELTVKQRELDAVKRNTRMMIEELENQNQALRNELLKMKNALLNPAQQQKKEDREAMEDSDDDEAEMETQSFAKDDSEYTCMTCSYQTNSDENLKRHKIIVIDSVRNIQFTAQSEAYLAF